MTTNRSQYAELSKRGALCMQSPSLHLRPDAIRDKGYVPEKRFVPLRLDRMGRDQPARRSEGRQSSSWLDSL